MKKWIALALALVASVIGIRFLFSMYPRRSAYVRFKTQSGIDYAHGGKLEDRVKARLLQDKLFISAYGLPENEEMAQYFKSSARALAGRG